MFAQIGSIPFKGLRGFTQFSDSRSTNLAEHGRIEGKPRLQRVGSNLHELSIGILLHASFTNPEDDFSRLDEAREISEIMPLILANGVYVGDYVIETIDRDVLQTDALSNIISMSVNLSLKEAYNPDPLKTLSITAKQFAQATSQNGATPLRVLDPLPPTMAQAASLDKQAMQLEAIRIDGHVQRADLLASERPYLGDRILEGLEAMERSSIAMQEKIIDPLLNPFAGTLPTALTAVLTSVNNFRSVLPITSMNDVKLLNTALQGSVGQLSIAAGALNNAVITRKL